MFRIIGVCFPLIFFFCDFFPREIFCDIPAIFSRLLVFFLLCRFSMISSEWRHNTVSVGACLCRAEIVGGPLADRVT